MVPRLLRLAATTLVALALLAPAAEAANTRVSIANYAWSNREVHVNLGEKVTWDWLGPDLAHSVTGISPNDLQWDSDPGTDAPSHRAGDSYTLQFTQPGIYFFQCKLHSFVRGEVVVSDVPGDPNSDPGPQPPLNIDVKPPTLGSVALAKQSVRGHDGIAFSAQVNERGRLDAEYYRLNSKGRRVYNGYKVWDTFIGINHLKLGARWKHFRARPGRYEVVLRATDQAANSSKPVTKRFTIVGPVRRRG
ncbi:MAG TPA: plastocyanin/azurin family copper-binding protein [Solirubrobacterales bacterium]|nr:plastocyanin/azurin family copper-binding protein [Solirubrobacterales bacterium]